MIALIGSGGMLGSDVANTCRCEGMTFTEFDMPDTDIGDYELTRQQLLDTGPRIVVNCAAYTAVDRAEEEPDTAARVNTGGPANLASICNELDIPLIHISTDYVFDGMATVPYTEQDTTSPRSMYGRTKLDGEQRIRELHRHYVILRTAWLYGIHGSSFVSTIRRLGKERRELTVVNDQWGSPTWAADLADAIVRIIDRIDSGLSDELWGTYHYTGDGVTTWYHFAETIIEECREHEGMMVQTIIPITTAEYPTLAQRPAYSVLDCRKIGRVFGIEQRNWRSSLKKMLNRLYKGADTVGGT